MKNFLTLFFLTFLTTPLFAQWSIDVEPGIAIQGYNEIRIPDEGGTLFDFNQDFNLQGPVIPIRLRLGFTFGERNHIFALYAPLGLRYDGAAPRTIDFENSTFPQGNNIDGYYQFNSYRLTYRRDLVRNDRWIVGVGFTGKIRDAVVRLRDESSYDFNDDVGFVPLIHLYTEYKLPKWSLYLEGDGLAAPQGRAFDFLVGGKGKIAPNLDLKAGYRVLEGGASNDTVYNFTIVNFGVVGLIYTL
ncbi:hypothetical protein [Litoribacter populi]|uniref:hypothetical protein n=1 Tax=Litoribacter populi TaxID=2598460 RepID=UPI00117F8315|nr:hypothetical protein [Litoribacter populi]